VPSGARVAALAADTGFVAEAAPPTMVAVAISFRAVRRERVWFSVWKKTVRGRRIS
jgi:hypothetical protein